LQIHPTVNLHAIYSYVPWRPSYVIQAKNSADPGLAAPCSLSRRPVSYQQKQGFPVTFRCLPRDQHQIGSHPATQSQSSMSNSFVLEFVCMSGSNFLCV